MPILMLIFIAVFGAGCNTATDWLRGDTGTTLGFSECLKQNKDTGLSEATVREQCLSKHAKSVFASITERTSYDCAFGICTFSGMLENTSDTQVITSVQVSIQHDDNKDEKGNVQSELGVADNLWIEPHSSQRVLFSGLKFQPNRDRIREGDKLFYHWAMKDAKGLEVKLR